MAYKKVKGSKGIGGAKKGSDATIKKGKPQGQEYCGIVDSRPENSDRKQSAE
jgi:hypothetical protein